MAAKSSSNQVNKAAVAKEELTFFRKRRLWLIFLVAFLLLVALDLVVRDYFRRPNLVLRNEGLSTMAVPYMLEQMSRSDKHVVAWCGSSTAQGLKTTFAEETAPRIAHKYLVDRGFDIETYNISVAGDMVRDNLALTWASIKSGADTVVFEILYEPFGNAMVKVGVPTKPEILYEARDMPWLPKKLKPWFKMKPYQWIIEQPSLFITDHWALLKYRTILNWVLFRRPANPAVQLGDELVIDAGMPIHRAGWDNYHDAPDRMEKDYTWRRDVLDTKTNRKMVQGVMGKKEASFDISENSVDAEILTAACNLCNRSKVSSLFYFAPINAERVKQIMDWDRFQQFKKTVSGVLEKAGCPVVDMSEAVDSRYFMDFIHSNRFGHKIYGRAMVDPLAKVLAADKQ